MTDLESDKGRPLTEEEMAELREMIERDKRAAWLWSNLRALAVWISAIIASVYALEAALKDFGHWMIK